MMHHIDRHAAIAATIIATAAEAVAMALFLAAVCVWLAIGCGA